MSIFEDQKEFMLAGNQTVNEFNLDQMFLYDSLIDEEQKEFFIANGEWYCENTLFQADTVKEAIDILVVVSGWLLSNGIDPQKAWDIVHTNNMAKVNDIVVKDSNGKIQKSPESIARKKQMMIDLMALVESDD